MKTLKCPTELVLQTFVVHIAVLVLTLQSAELDLTHRTQLLQNSSQASLLESQFDTLKRQESYSKRYGENSISKLCGPRLNTHSISMKS